MDEEVNIPQPIRFNPLKHHRNYLLRLLESASPELIINMLDPVCNNYIDLYTGSLTFEEITGEVVDTLKSMEVMNAKEFIRWINGNYGYRKIFLSDESEWIVRQGDENERYIHLHPSRTGPFTIRLKGSTLKTICLLKINSLPTDETPSLETVNRLRFQAGLSPINKLDPDKGILSNYEKFFLMK